MKCIFEPCSGKNDLVKSTEYVIDKIIVISKEKDDDIYKEIEKFVSENENHSLYYHKSCYCSYTSASRNCSDSRKRKAPCSSIPDRVTKSQVHKFTREDFKVNCFLCGEKCSEKDKKNPKRWRPWCLCDKEPLDKYSTNFKDTLLDICGQKDDEWGKQVEIRLRAVTSSLPAFDGRYHRDCYNKFYKIPKKSTNADSCKLIISNLIQAVVNHITTHKSTTTWTITEL